jgi:hypothetical protein
VPSLTRLSARAFSEPLDSFHGLSDGSGHGSLYAFGDEVCYQLPDDCVVFDRGNYAALGVLLAGGLMQEGVGSN